MDSLLRLVDDLQVLRAAWEDHPVVSTGLGGFDDVFSVDQAQLLLSQLPLAAVRLFRDGRQLPAAAFARSAGRAGRGGDRSLVDGPALARHLRDGGTVVLEELQTYSPQVAAFAAGVSRATGYGTYCAAFLTPGRARGVAPHYDTASVFVRQVLGAKRWQVRAPVRRWPDREWTPGTDVDTTPVLDVVLREGDCLYIPRGFVHAGEATGQASVHLSVGVLPTTWGTVLNRLLATAAQDCEPLREALPPAFARVDRAALYRERLAALAGCLSRLEKTDVPPEALHPAVADPPAAWPDLGAALRPPVPAP